MAGRVTPAMSTCQTSVSARTGINGDGARLLAVRAAGVPYQVLEHSEARRENPNLETGANQRSPFSWAGRRQVRGHREVAEASHGAPTILTGLSKRFQSLAG